MANNTKSTGLLFSAEQLRGLDYADTGPTEPPMAKQHNRTDYVRKALTDYFKLHGCGKNKIKRKR